VYRLERVAAPLVKFISAGAVAVPFIYLIYAVIVFFLLNHKKKNNQEITESDRGAYAFAMESPLGSVLQVLKCTTCALPPGDTPPLTLGWFLLTLLETLIEAVGIPLVAMFGCAPCDYPDTYILMLIKTSQFFYSVYDYFKPGQVAGDGAATGKAEIVPQPVLNTA
jgi:hypothetical protein